MIVRRLFLCGFAAALVTAFGCSNGSDSGGGTPAPAIACTDGGAAGVNTVTLTCGGASNTTTELVNVVLGGPAAGFTMLRGLNFDVVYDPAKIQFVPAATYTSPLFPGALIAVTLANNQEGRLVVSIQLPGGSADSSAVPGANAVLSLSFKSVSGATFTPSPLTFDNMEATGASAAVTFASSLALSY